MKIGIDKVTRVVVTSNHYSTGLVVLRFLEDSKAKHTKRYGTKTSVKRDILNTCLG